MLVSDALLIATLAAFLPAAGIRGLPLRGVVLLLAPVVAIAIGLYGVSVDRWQAGAGAAVASILLLAALIGCLFRQPLRGGWRALALSGATLLVALGIAPLLLFPVSPLPKPDGPYAIGLRSFALTDSSRRGVLNDGPGAPRRLLLRVWYPALPVAGMEPRAYFDGHEAETTARGFGSLFGFPPLLTHLRHVRTNAYENAPLLAGPAKRPVIFFSHGYTAYVAADSVLMEKLASHGYIIFSVQHTGDASPTVFPGGDVAPMDPGLIEHMRHVLANGFSEAMVRGYTSKDFGERLDGQLRTATEIPPPGNRAFAISAPVWLADRLFVHDALQAGAVPANVAEIVAASDLSRTGEMGISFGGSTSGAVCMVDPRCAAAVNLDGGDFHGTPFNADIPVPLLMFHADFRGLYRMLGANTDGELRSFNDFSYERLENAGQRSDIYRMVLKDSVHSGLTDSAMFLRRPLRDPLFGSAPIDILIGAPNDFVLGFFDKHLRGLDNGFPQTQYQRYAGWVSPYDNSPVRQWWLAQSPEQRARIERRIEDVKAAMKQSANGGRHE